MNVSELLKPESVLCDAEANSKKHAIELLSQLLARADESLVADDVFASLIERERLGCTALGNGMAMPHARNAAVRSPTAAFLRLAAAVEFDTPDDRPVDLIFGLIVPEKTDEEDVRDFETIMHRFGNPEFQQLLRTAANCKLLFQSLQQNLLSEAGDAHSDGDSYDQAIPGGG